MLLLFASDDVGMQQPSSNTVLKRILSATREKVATDLVLWLVSLEFRRMPIDIHLQHFPVKVSDECQVLTQEMRWGTCSRLAEIMQRHA